MEIQNQVQLVALLDKLSELYRGGVPSAFIDRVPSSVSPGAETNHPRLRLVVSGNQDSLSQEELSLLDAIATNGLRLTAGEYTKEFLESGVDPFSADSMHAPVTILFGFTGVSTKGGGTVIHSAAVSQLVADATSKKTLWRELQSRWPK